VATGTRIASSSGFNAGTSTTSVSAVVNTATAVAETTTYVFKTTSTVVAATTGGKDHGGWGGFYEDSAGSSTGVSVQGASASTSPAACSARSRKRRVKRDVVEDKLPHA
jgi:hypothetical protein